MTSTPTRPFDNVVIATKGLQDRNITIIAGTTVENKVKLILTKLEKHASMGWIDQVTTDRDPFLADQIHIQMANIFLDFQYIF